MQQRALSLWKHMLADYKVPPIDADVDEALVDFIDRKKASVADAWY